jgi:hypothetical protein
MKKVFSALSIGAILFFMACSGSKDESVDPPPPPPTATCDGVAISYTTNVHPIISTKCATNSGCHGAGSVNGPGPLTSYTLVKAAAANIKSAVVSGRMPKTGSISAAEVNTIKCWADNGTPE